MKGCLINLKRAQRHLQNANETISLVTETRGWSDGEIDSVTEGKGRSRGRKERRKREGKKPVSSASAMLQKSHKEHLIQRGKLSAKFPKSQSN